MLIYKYCIKKRSLCHRTELRFFYAKIKRIERQINTGKAGKRNEMEIMCLGRNADMLIWNVQYCQCE